MIQIFPAEKRYIQRMGWLDVYSVFSCNNYFDQMCIRDRPIPVWNPPRFPFAWRKTA